MLTWSSTVLTSPCQGSELKLRGKNDLASFLDPEHFGQQSESLRVSVAHLIEMPPAFGELAHLQSHRDWCLASHWQWRGQMA